MTFQHWLQIYKRGQRVQKEISFIYPESEVELVLLVSCNYVESWKKKTVKDLHCMVKLHHYQQAVTKGHAELFRDKDRK